MIYGTLIYVKLDRVEEIPPITHPMVFPLKMYTFALLKKIKIKYKLLGPISE